MTALGWITDPPGSARFDDVHDHCGVERSLRIGGAERQEFVMEIPLRCGRDP